MRKAEWDSMVKWETIQSITLKTHLCCACQENVVVGEKIIYTWDMAARAMVHPKGEACKNADYTILCIQCAEEKGYIW